MLAAVIIASLILAFAGNTASQEPECRNIVDCYTKLRKEIVGNLHILLGPEPTEGNLKSYATYCRLKAPQPPSPCNRSEDYKDCFKRADIEAREEIYRELWKFVCSGNGTTWKRFMGILYSKTNDPCQGALNATKDVLQGDLSKCGAVKKLLNECISQKNFVTNLQESGMELLGCKQEEPVSTTARPTPPAPARPQCNKDAAARCLKMSAKALEASMGFENSDAQAGQSGCTPVSCLERYSPEGCSHDEVGPLSSLQHAIEAVQTAACGYEQALLKNIRRTASCFNMEGFKRCVNESHIDISKSMLSKEECGSYTSSISKCIEKSGKQCQPAIESARNLSSVFFSVYGCGQEHGGIPAGKPTGRNSSPSLASSLTMTLSAALVIAIRR